MVEVLAQNKCLLYKSETLLLTQASRGR